MNPILLHKILFLLDKLGAIRKDLTKGCYVETDKNGFFELEDRFSIIGNEIHLKYERHISYGRIKYVIGHKPILSDCLLGLYNTMDKINSEGGNMSLAHVLDLAEMWDLNKPYLFQQDDSLGEELLALLS